MVMFRITCLFVMAFAIATEASGACVCWIRPLWIKADGSAIGEGKRYEDGDCEVGQCQFPTQCLDYRLKWGAAEYCPSCRPYGTTTSAIQTEDCAGTIASSAGSAVSVGADAEAEPEAPEPPQLEGLPVKENFNPTDPETIPEGALPLPNGTKATFVGYFTLGIKNKVAINIASDACLKLGRDVEVKVFRVSFPKQNGEQLDDAWIAYEVTRSEDSEEPATRIAPLQISDIRYEPLTGNQAFTLRVAHGKLRGRSVFLFRGPE
jgi:hypothetical protein